MTRFCVSTMSLLLATALIAGLTFAHSDMDKPLFVANEGVDRGRCLDPKAPCRTVGYALSRVGKGGQIRVAAGRYQITDPTDVFHLVSGLVNARGGFETADNFQQPTSATTTLIGVPQEYRSVLGSRGFHIVADRKGLDSTAVRTTEKMLALHNSMATSMPSAPCVGGTVNGLACQDTELLSHVAFSDVSANPGTAADVWGFVDLNTNREYAIVGYRTGTAVFDVTDAENPREVGFVDGQATTWRDIKVYQFFNAAENRWNAYAYVTADGSTDGLFIIDLTELPHRISRQSYVSDFSAAHNVFAINTDFGTGLSLTGAAPSLIIAGSNNGGGRFRVYSLASADSPSFVVIPNVSVNDYMHDAASMIIRDSRKDTQCVNSADYCEVLFDFNESTVDVWDITIPANPVRLSRTQYVNSAYTHSGWPSEDGQYLFVHDELDEQNFGLQTTVRTLSLADLTSPVEVGTWSGPTTAIDHNGFVRGNRYYMSNYSRGLTILDISDPTTLNLTGRLDTYPFSDGANFVGAWGAYPYFHSGNIAVSDISSGFYMVGDNTLDSPQGSLSFTQSSFAGAEGDVIAVTVQRSGGSTGNVSVGLNLMPATADESDIAGQAGALTWVDGDTADKQITFTVAADGAAEGLERMLAKLVAPTGGATLLPASVASIYVGDVGDAAVIEFDKDVIDINERGFAVAVVAITRSGAAIGAASVDYSLSGGNATTGSDYQGVTSGTVSWADGDADSKWIEFPIVDDGTGEADEFFEITLAAPSGASLGGKTLARINIFDGDGANQAPNAVAGSSQTVQSGALVTLNGSASSDADGDSLTYQWTQTLGPTVTINNVAAASVSFTAPTVTSDTLLQFRLEVSDPSGLNDTSTTNITVRAQVGGNGFGSSGGSGAFGGLLLAILTAMLLARRRISRTDFA
ncbi:MAG: choice-of-anchor B family protein [Gammaproteobacteria bacterium]|nr:choice-of-anchor B family protein [Gammaproteobacteria bacterium]